jgi:hypothetical protein
MRRKRVDEMMLRWLMFRLVGNTAAMAFAATALAQDRSQRPLRRRPPSRKRWLPSKPTRRRQSRCSSRVRRVQGSSLPRDVISFRECEGIGDPTAEACSISEKDDRADQLTEIDLRSSPTRTLLHVGVIAVSPQSPLVHRRPILLERTDSHQKAPTPDGTSGTRQR